MKKQYESTDAAPPPDKWWKTAEQFEDALVAARTGAVTSATSSAGVAERASEVAAQTAWRWVTATDGERWRTDSAEGERRDVQDWPYAFQTEELRRITESWPSPFALHELRRRETERARELELVSSFALAPNKAAGGAATPNMTLAVMPMTKGSNAATATQSLPSRSQEMLAKGDHVQFVSDAAQDLWTTGKIQDVFDIDGAADDSDDARGGHDGGRGGGDCDGGGSGCVLIDACDHGTHEKARFQRRTLRLLQSPHFPQHSSDKWQDSAHLGLHSLDDLAGVWVDSEKPEQVMRVVRGWVFNFEGQSEERGVVEITKAPPPRDDLVLEQKQWTHDGAASSGRRAVWKRKGKDDVVWWRRGGHPSTVSERDGTAAPRGGYAVMHGEILGYCETAKGTWSENGVEFLKLMPTLRVIDGSAPLKIVRSAVWPADDEKNATSHNKNKLSAGDVVCFSRFKPVQIPFHTPGTDDAAATAASTRSPHVVFFYELADGRGWVHDYVPLAPVIRRLEVRCSLHGRCF